MQLSTYIFFNGNCSDAVKFYEKHLGAKVVMMMPFPRGKTPSFQAEKSLSSRTAFMVLPASGTAPTSR